MNAVDSFLASLAKLPELPKRIAEAAAPELEKAARANAAAGRDPDGNPWPAKKDGTRPLEHAGEHISGSSAGATATLTLEGADVYHQNAKPGGRLPKRRVIPDGPPTPAYLNDVLVDVAGREFAKTMGGK